MRFLNISGILVILGSIFSSSEYLIPTRVKVSPMSDVLILLSTADEEDNDGRQFTSTNNGLKCLSIKMSNPNISKQQCFCVPMPAIEFYTSGSILMHDLMHMSLMRCSSTWVWQDVLVCNYSIHFVYVHLDALSSSALLHAF